MRQRVHFVNRFFHPDHSATSLILSGVAMDLVRAGHDVHVTTSRQLYEKADANLPAEQLVDGVAVHRVATTRFGRSGLFGRAADYFSFYLGAAHSLWRNVRPGDVVVAKTDPPLISLVAAPIARMRGAQYVNWLQDVFPEVATGLGLGGPGARLVLAPLRSLRNWSLRVAARNVVIGDRMGERIAAEGAPRDSLVTIPNWADQTLLEPVAHTDNELRREWGLEGKVVVGYSGNLGRVHDLGTIVGAIAEVEQRIASGLLAEDIVFLFVGGGAKRGTLEREIAQRGLTRVRLLPYQPEHLLARSLSAADIHLVSLLPDIEGLVVPSKMYGIMGVGRPTLNVGAADGEIARLLARHRCGETVGIGESGKLAERICTLATDPDRRHAMGSSARRAFLAEHTRAFAALSWHTLLTGLYAASPRPTTEEAGAWPGGDAIEAVDGQARPRP
jgi:glycosyltransferase involved in cell wall biosynthesis